jgi:hypothetical protein
MTIQVGWADDAQTIMLLTYQTGWTWADFRSALQRSGELSQHVHHTFYMVNDVRAASELPEGQAISQFRTAGQNNAPTLRYIYIVGTNMFATSLLNTMKKLVPNIANTWRLVPRIEDAYAQIEADKKNQPAS